MSAEQDEPQMKPKHVVTRAIEWASQFQLVVGILFGIALTVVAAAFWTRDQARAAVRDPAFVETLSKLVRPFLTVDSQRTVESDYGAADLLSDMRFEVQPNLTEMKITFSFKTHMNNPPLVQALDPGLYMHHTERGPMHDWHVWMRVAPETVSDTPGGMTMQLSTIDSNHRYRFLVQILH